MSKIMFLWSNFLDWITGRRIADVVISAIGEIRGPVRRVHRMRDRFVVFTDYEVYEVRFESYMDRIGVRRIP